MQAHNQKKKGRLSRRSTHSTTSTSTSHKQNFFFQNKWRASSTAGRGRTKEKLADGNLTVETSAHVAQVPRRLKQQQVSSIELLLDSEGLRVVGARVRPKAALVRCRSIDIGVLCHLSQSSCGVLVLATLREQVHLSSVSFRAAVRRLRAVSADIVRGVMLVTLAVRGAVHATSHGVALALAILQLPEGCHHLLCVPCRGEPGLASKVTCPHRRRRRCAYLDPAYSRLPHICLCLSRASSEVLRLQTHSAVELRA